MWLRLIIFLIILSAIDDSWEEKIKKQRNKKRKYRLLKGATYLCIATLALLLVNYIGNEAYFYVLISILVAGGAFLSAINPNLREMYIVLLVLGTIISIVSFYYERHKIIFTLVDIWLAASIIVAIKEGIHNMRRGIDPDVIAEQETAKKKFRKALKLAKVLFKIWR